MEEIVQAIDNGDFTISYNTPNNVKEGEHPWGVKWLFVSDVDSARTGAYLGGCTVTVCVEDDEFEYEYDYESESWDGDDVTDEIIEAL